MAPFWLIVRLSGGILSHDKPPTKQHPSYELAQAEARRLALKFPGDDFIVLAAVQQVKGTVQVDSQPMDYIKPTQGILGGEIACSTACNGIARNIANEIVSSKPADHYDF